MPDNETITNSGNEAPVTPTNTEPIQPAENKAPTETPTTPKAKDKGKKKDEFAVRDIEIPQEVYDRYDDNLNLIEKKTEPAKPQAETTSETTTDPGDKDKKAPEATPNEQRETEEIPEVMSDETFKAKFEEGLKQFVTPEQKSQFIKDLFNYPKFWASVTQKSQQVSEREKQINSLAQTFGLEEFQTKMQAVLQHPELNELLAAIPDFLTKDNKVVNDFIELFRTGKAQQIKTNIDTHFKEREALREEKSEIEYQKEALAVREFDPQYKDETKLNELAKYALAFPIPIDLLTAAKLIQAEKHSDKIKSLQAQIKEQNQIIKEMREDPARIVYPRSKTVDGKTAKKTKWDEPPKSEQELDERLNLKWDELMAVNDK